MRKINFFLQIAFVLFIGIKVFFYLLEHDQAFKSFIEENLKTIFAENFSCCLQGTLSKIDMLGGEIELHNVSTLSHDKGEWEWHARKFNLSFSWINIIATASFNLTVVLEQVKAQSRLKGSDIGIVHHLLRLMGGAEGIPIGLQELHVTKGQFGLDDYEHDVHYTTRFNLHTYMNNKNIKVDLSALDGAIQKDQRQWCKDWSCLAKIFIKNLEDPTVSLQLQGNMLLSDLEVTKNYCSYNAAWQNDYGSFALQNGDDSFFLSLRDIQLTDKKNVAGDLSLVTPLSFLQKNIVPDLAGFEGVGTVKAHIVYNDKLAIEGVLDVNNVAYAGNVIGSLQSTFNANNRSCSGDFYGGKSNDKIVEGVWSVNPETFDGNLHFSNTATIEIPALSYSILPKNSVLEADFLLSGSCSASFAVHADHAEKNMPIDLKGFVQGADCLYTVTGKFNELPFDGALNLMPAETVLQLNYQDLMGKNLFKVSTKKENWQQFEGCIDYQLMQNCIDFLFGTKIPGEGKFLFSGQLGSEIALKIDTQNSNIRIPGIYNLIRGLNSVITFDIETRKMVIHSAKLELDRGAFECKRALIAFENDGAIAYSYFPCSLQKTVLALDKDFFALLSGHIIFTQGKNNTPHLQGSVIIDKAYMKKNIFSLAAQQQSFSFLTRSKVSSGDNQCNVDLTIQTKDSLHVKTSFLEANARLNIGIKGTLENPRVSGSLNLERGILGFPYKPLTITHAMIHFLPNQLFDPLVELVAKGMIRKYHVVMRCDGSLQNPHISFESTPPLTEEQIITLLLAGSEEGSLSLVVPSVIMQGMQNVLFGPEQSSSKLERYFKTLLGPLKHIRFVPKFFDPQGRGGFRGAIEIDVNDQLHGMIQRNFSLPEDIKLEVEYFFADDIAIRAIRDERGDFGGEVEMRWKF